MVNIIALKEQLINYNSIIKFLISVLFEKICNSRVVAWSRKPQCRLLKATINVHMLQYRPKQESACKLFNQTESMWLKVDESKKYGQKAVCLTVTCTLGPMALLVPHSQCLMLSPP